MSYAPHIIRFVVEFFDGCPVPVSYNVGLGASVARRYALTTARNYAGRCFAHYSDGSIEEVGTISNPVLGADRKAA